MRGSLTSRIKSALFSVFGENDLLQINTRATPKEINEWKQSHSVGSCYEKLFDPVGRESSVTYMSQILEKVWPSGRTPKVHIAYAIGVCVTLLNPRNDNIKISASGLKSKTDRYLVRLRKSV